MSDSLDRMATEVQCSLCHSFHLVSSHRGDEAYWLEVVERMQRDHGLLGLEEPRKTQIVRHLSERFGPDVVVSEQGPIRRQPLPARLRPAR
ncbi:MAG: hypothetical protein AAF196_07430 [Planctomycetota bacterium]